MRSSIPSSKLFKMKAKKQVNGFLLSVKTNTGLEYTKIFVEAKELWNTLNIYQAYQTTITSIMACKGDPQ